MENDLVDITSEQKSPLPVSVELALKPDLSNLNTENLFFYSYDATKNRYTRITTPDYWVDTNGYSHMTVPFSGSVIITNAPLTAK